MLQHQSHPAPCHNSPYPFECADQPSCFQHHPITLSTNTPPVYHPAQLAGSSQAPGASRDVVLLDIALDSYLRLLVERTEKSSLQGDDLCELVALMLRNALVTFDSEDLSQVCRLWGHRACFRLGKASYLCSLTCHAS